MNEEKYIEPIESEKEENDVVNIKVTLDNNGRIVMTMMFDKEHKNDVNSLIRWLKGMKI